MKTRLNITTEDTVLALIKSYAAAKQLSVSQIIEDHLRSIVETTGPKRSILEVVDQMDTPTTIQDEEDLVKAYYEAASEKYGK